jgi:APA family basic amino acid/polyamine antiporter
VAEIHPRFGTPSFSILIQGIWSAILAVSGSYEMLIAYALFAMWTFHGMAVFSVLILRRKHPERARPYKMWGYPVTPLLFVLFALWFVLNTLISRPVSSSASALIMAAGVAAYFVWNRTGAGKLNDDVGHSTGMNR